ncbi:hypothetical protein DFR58_103158 [Anaerobacterium chartisolvens]|uniref:Photosynthesis system II assembly factor Ycf48/Hcf136-like domain-containing protein n=1 Tax=Anaerobacterium chartisolvens TaxID=1297424 RepID=A0A369BCZ9_9FIRM|nr:hypothetical protein [Anaerobacterium chartisolvens]RCX19413.1 hypothetical protein DFR58_103158 [Anaerobacterium chartisolvens]
MKKIIAGILSLLIAIVLAGPVNAEQAPIKSPESSIWQTGKIAASIESFSRVVCFKNKLYVAIAAGGKIKASVDGINWTENLNTSHEIPSELNDIICTNSQIVAVGHNGTFLRSTNGYDWNVVKPITTSSIEKIIVGKNLFLAFTDKQGEILTSSNGKNWKIQKTALKQYVSDAVWNGKVFVAVGAKGEISTSKDGVAWQTKTLKNKPGFNKIVWNGKLFVASGTTYASTDEYDYTSGLYIATSRDGYNWGINTLMTKYLKKNSREIYICMCENIIWNGKSFILIVNEITGQGPGPECRLITYSSLNGVKWQRTNANVGGDSLVTVWSGKAFVAAVNYFALPGYWYEYDIYYSSDGVKWKKAFQQSRANHKINDIIYNNGKFVAVGDNGEAKCSTDGVNWIESEMIHTPQFWDGNKFISIDSETYSIYSSKDGLEWKKENKSAEEIIRWGICWSGKEYVSFGPDFYLAASKDLVSWDKIKPAVMDSFYKNVGQINAFASDGSTYIIAGSDGTAVSSDMKSWVSRKELNYYKSIIIGSSNYLAINTYGQIDASPDGFRWKRIKIKDYNNSIIKIIYSNNKFIGIGSNGEVWYSKNGTDWAKAESHTNKALKDICWTGNEFIAAGDEGIIITSKDGVNWRQEESPLNISFSTVCTNGKIVIISGPGGFIYKSLK